MFLTVGLWEKVFHRHFLGETINKTRTTYKKIISLFIYNENNHSLQTLLSFPLAHKVFFSSPFVHFFLSGTFLWAWSLLTHIWTEQSLFYQWKVSTCLWSYHLLQIKDSWHIIYALVKGEVFRWSRAAKHSQPLFWSNDFLLIECSKPKSEALLCVLFALFCGEGHHIRNDTTVLCIPFFFFFLKSVFNNFQSSIIKFQASG